MVKILGVKIPTYKFWEGDTIQLITVVNCTNAAESSKRMKTTNNLLDLATGRLQGFGETI